MLQKTLTASAAFIATVAFVGAIHAETTVTRTTTTTTEITNAPMGDDVYRINFEDFDLNDDGMFARSEVGEKLFYIFDTDGNEAIDNLEWDDKKIYTIVPMDSETIRFVDYDGDNVTELSSYTYEIFYTDTGLTRFDDDLDGLSAKEFIETGFEELDKSDNKMIELHEWQDVYIKSLTPLNAEQGRYN